MKALQIISFLLFITTFTNCKKSATIVVPDNTAPYHDKIPQLLIENYINRLFIDLLGREPLDLEMEQMTIALKKTNVSPVSRDSLISLLQTDTTFIPQDTSYRKAYYHWFYELTKAHLIEGASIDEIKELANPPMQSLQALQASGDTLSEEYQFFLEEVTEYQNLILAEENYFSEKIDIQQFIRIMIDNGVYDEINMNSFNFINATFDNLLFRTPTQYEFSTAFTMVEHSQPAILFEQSGASKENYIDIFVQSKEFYEGLIIWGYRTLLARQPTTVETIELLQDFYIDHDFQKIQRKIMTTNEYANF